jgi:hypothetical protein
MIHINWWSALPMALLVPWFLTSMWMVGDEVLFIPHGAILMFFNTAWYLALEHVFSIAFRGCGMHGLDGALAWPPFPAGYRDMASSIPLRVLGVMPKLVREIRLVGRWPGELSLLTHWCYTWFSGITITTSRFGSPTKNKDQWSWSWRLFDCSKITSIAKPQ